MDNRIKNAIDTVAPSEEQKTRMFSAITRRAEQEGEIIRMTDKRRPYKKPLRVALIAAAIGFLFIATVFAEEIGSYFSGFLTRDAVVSESVATGVFADSDGHVEMTVEELLTDRSVIRSVVHYRALDGEGQSWLADFKEENLYESSMDAEFMVWTDETTSGSWNVAELDEYRTDSDAYFCLTADCTGGTAESVTLRYPMTAENRETALDMIKTADVMVCAINPEQTVFSAEGCTFWPTEVELSPLSVSVYGKQEGIAYFEKWDNGWGAFSLAGGETEIVSSLYLVRADGSKLTLDGFASGLRQQSYSQSYDSDDYIFCHLSFAEPVDVSEYTGIEFNGEYFPFVIE